MSKEELANETLLAVLDLEENSFAFSDQHFEAICFFCEKIQDYLELLP